MTVKEVIKVLKKYPPDNEVLLLLMDEHNFRGVTGIDCISSSVCGPYVDANKGPLIHPKGYIITHRG